MRARWGALGWVTYQGVPTLGQRGRLTRCDALQLGVAAVLGA
ncbi:MAG: hypothetical protein P8L46_03185 [Acidimicrobiales bacterium]|nr:hypothetical protein [Acidimicrobiales bacterium]MDG2217029.1 hypothetical protein [Acidimicrobiales bacterium]